MSQPPINRTSERELEQPADGWQPIIRLAVGFGLALAGAVVAALVLT